MNVNTLIVSREEAQRKLEQYRSITDKRRLVEDDKLQSLYAAVSKGARVINVANAFSQTGLNDKGEPKLAIARADLTTISCFPRSNGSAAFQPRGSSRAASKRIELPAGTFAWPRETWKYNLFSPVPHIPPSVRPQYGLHNYHVLFEVQEWQHYPVDPFLMRRISGMLFTIVGEWELTPLEAELLAAMQAGN